MWSSRLVKSVNGLGHEAVLKTQATEEPEQADAAIVNLGSSTLKPEHLVPQLSRAGIKVIGHAGHKEKELHEIGRDLGCHLLVTNSELTHKLPQILQKV